MKKRLLSLGLALCMMLSLMPTTYASSGVSVKYIDATGWEGKNPTGFILSETKNENTIGVFINSENDASYMLKEDATGLVLAINNVDVTIGEGIGFGDFRLAGSSSLNMGPVTISPGSYTDSFIGNVSDADDVIGFFTSENFEGTEDIPGAAYSFNMTDDFELGDWLDAYSLKVAQGKIFTQNSIINARFVRADGSIYIGASSNPEEPNGLNIEDGGSLVVGDGGSITADDGQILEIRSGASVSGITLYDYDGTEYTGGFENTETFYYNAEESRWVRQNPGNSGGVGDNEYRINYDTRDGAEVSLDGLSINSGEVYNFTENEEMDFDLTLPEGIEAPYKIIVSPNGEEETEILTYSNGEFSYEPQNSNGFEIDIYWTQGEYDYRAFGTSENETMVESGWFGEGTVTVDSDNQITYGNWTKVVVDNSTDSISLTLKPNDGGDPAYDFVEIVIDHNDRLSKQDLIDGGYYNEDTFVLSMPLERDISYYNLEFYFTENQGGDPNPGESNPGESNPGDSGQDPATDYDGAKDAILLHEYAYYVDTTKEEAAAIVKDYLATELWYEFFGNVNGNNRRPYYGMFSGEEDGAPDDLKNAITLSEISTENDSVINLPYYNYRVDLSGDVSAEGKVYVLGSAKQFIVRTGNTYNVVDTSALGGENNDIYVSGDGTVSVFGNGVCVVGALETGDDSLWAGHITQEHSGLWNDPIIGGLGCRLAVCPENYVGAKIVGGIKAAAWGFAEVPVFAAGSDGSPAIAEIYYGNDGSDHNRTVTISTLTDSRDENPNDRKAVAGIALDTRYISSSVADIDKVQDGFEITFHSSYDEIPLVITYSDGTKGYVTIHRVGLNLADGTVNTGEFVVWHGTDNTQHYTLQGSGTRVVSAAFYYATGNTVPADSERVSLSVTATMTDGTVTRKIITSSERLNSLPIDTTGGDRYCDDFLVWSGTEEEYNNLQKVEVIAFVAGDDDTFGGVKAGSGTGVVWTRSEN